MVRSSKDGKAHRAEVFDDCFCKTRYIETRVGEETRIFGRYKGIDHDVGQIFIGDVRSFDIADLGNHLVISVIDDRRLFIDEILHFDIRL